MPKLDLTPYRGEWDLTPAEITERSAQVINLATKLPLCVAAIEAAQQSDDESMFNKAMQTYERARNLLIDCYIDVLLSTLRNRVRSAKH